jgi:ribosome modulation factor
MRADYHSTFTAQEIIAAFKRGRNDCKRGLSRAAIPYKDIDRQEGWLRGYDFQMKIKRSSSR